MTSRDVQWLARELFVRVASQVGVLARNPEADQWVELICSGAGLDDEDREVLEERAGHLRERCRMAASVFFRGDRPLGDEHLRPIHALMDGKEWSGDTLQDIAQVLARAGHAIRQPLQPPEPRYTCPECGSNEVELCFPVWVRANEMDNRELWDLDAEASPAKDSDKGWCIECQANVLVRIEEGSSDGP